MEKEEKKIEQYEGTPIIICGKKWIVPGLSLGQIENNKDEISKIINNKNNDIAIIGVISKVVYLALSRNYPDITQKEVNNIVDMCNMKKFADAAMGQSGFVVNGAAESGEVPPAAQA